MATQAAIKARWHSKAVELMTELFTRPNRDDQLDAVIKALQSAYEQGLGAGLDPIEQRNQRDESHG